MKQKFFITSLATVTACMVLGFIFSRFVLPVSAENGADDGKSTYYFDVSSDYLTPQQFGASGEDKVDDTEAFRKLFAAAYQEGLDMLPSSHWVRCKPIYIPSGTYYISEPIVDEYLTTEKNNKIRYAKYEVFGAGRESTQIKLTSKDGVLFDNQIRDVSDAKVIFGFSTFRDVLFDGNQNNSFMLMAASNPNSNGTSTDGVQRLQFLSCGFTHFKKILECKEKAKQMLSEITFSYCRINDCGKSDNACRLFTLTDPQAVNWRFDYTDIESIEGDIFYFNGATAITLNGGSVIIKSGHVFNFEFYSDDANGPGYGNSPQVLCDGTRFEIWNQSSLIRTMSQHFDFPKVTFRSCVLNATYINEEDNHPATPNLFMIEGNIDALFEDCFSCHEMRIAGGVLSDERHYYQPKLTFRNCSDINIDKLVEKSTWVGTCDAAHYQDNRNVRIIVDDSYDFYLYRNNDNSYVHTISGLNECRQQVDLGGKYSKFDLNKDKIKTFTVKPYGFVKYVELTVPKQSVSGEATLRLYETAGETRKQIGEDVKITFDSNRTHMIVINDYIEKLEAEFSYDSSKTGASMNMTIVKY